MTRDLTPEEQAQVDAFTAKLTAPVVPPAPDGFDHWPSQPHGAADISTPHHVPKKKWKTLTFGELKEIAAGHKAKADAAAAAEAEEKERHAAEERDTEAALEAAEAAEQEKAN